MTSARDEILARIRGGADVPVPRDYRRAVGGSPDELCELFVSRAAEYTAAVRRVGESQVRERVGRSCDEHGARRMLMPGDLPEAWRPEGLELIGDDDLSYEELDAVDGVITGCAAAIAESGTVVLDGGAGQGRRAITLIPDLHVCVVEREQVVGSLPEAIDRLLAARAERRPLTFISGPSATSDIELRRVEGVHGPRRLELIVAG